MWACILPPCPPPPGKMKVKLRLAARTCSHHDREAGRPAAETRGAEPTRSRDLSLPARLPCADRVGLAGLRYRGRQGRGQPGQGSEEPRGGLECRWFPPDEGPGR